MALDTVTPDSLEAASKWERDVLDYDPFAGDKDDGGYRTLRDRIITARKSGPCAEWGEQVAPGTRVRAMTAVGDGHVATTRSCHACCEAMFQWVNGNEAPMEERYKS